MCREQRFAAAEAVADFTIGQYATVAEFERFLDKVSDGRLLSDISARILQHELGASLALPFLAELSERGADSARFSITEGDKYDEIYARLTLRLSDGDWSDMGELDELECWMQLPDVRTLERLFDARVARKDLVFFVEVAVNVAALHGVRALFDDWQSDNDEPLCITCQGSADDLVNATVRLSLPSGLVLQEVAVRDIDHEHIRHATALYNRAAQCLDRGY